MKLSKLKQIFKRILTCGRKKDSDSKKESKPQTTTESDNTENDPYGSLSEVAAPIPVERTAEEEKAQHDSVDTNLSESHSQPHLSNN
jgi:C1A family cysteine protease